MTTCADDILQALNALRYKPLCDAPAESWQGPPAADHAPEASEMDEATRIRILENLNHVPVHVDELVRAVNVPVSYVMSILLEFELAGRIERQAGNKVNLI